MKHRLWENGRMAFDWNAFLLSVNEWCDRRIIYVTWRDNLSRHVNCTCCTVIGRKLFNDTQYFLWVTMDDTLCTLVAFFPSQFDSVLKFLELEWPTRGSILHLSYFGSFLVPHLFNNWYRSFVVPTMWWYSHMSTIGGSWRVTAVVAYMFLGMLWGPTNEIFALSGGGMLKHCSRAPTNHLVKFLFASVLLPYLHLFIIMYFVLFANF